MSTVELPATATSIKERFSFFLSAESEQLVFFLSNSPKVSINPLTFNKPYSQSITQPVMGFSFSIFIVKPQWVNRRMENADCTCQMVLSYLTFLCAVSEATTGVTLLFVVTLYTNKQSLDNISERGRII